MTSRLSRIVWSPHDDSPNRFIVASNDLRLYEYQQADDAGGVSGQSQFTCVAVHSDIQLMKCFSWCPSQHVSDLIAIGQTDGRIRLIRPSLLRTTAGPAASVHPTSADNYHMFNSGSSQIIYPDLPVRHTRACNCIDFSTASPNLLASGLDKAKHQHGLVIWDIEQARAVFDDALRELQGNVSTESQRDPTHAQSGRSSPTNSDVMSVKTGQDIAAVSVVAGRGLFSRAQVAINQHPSQKVESELKPIREFGLAEACFSCAWMRQSSSHVVAGMANKFLRVYDIRAEGANSAVQIPTKAVYGVKCDPFREHRFASFMESEPIVYFWDMRRPTEPILVLNTGEQAKKSSERTMLNAPAISTVSTGLCDFAFSRDFSGLFATLQKESRCLKIWELQESSTRKLETRTINRQPKAAGRVSMLSATSGEGGMFSGFFGGSGSGSGTANNSYSHLLPGPAETEFSNAGVESIPVIWKSRQTEPSMRLLSDFAWISGRTSGTKQMITINRDGLLDLVLIGVARDVDWDPLGGLIIAEESLGPSLTRHGPGLEVGRDKTLDKNASIGPSVSGTAAFRAPYENDFAPPKSAAYYDASGLRTPFAWPHVYSSRRNSNDLIELAVKRVDLVEAASHEFDQDGIPGVDNSWITTISATLAEDISVTMRDRARVGYSFDCGLNIRIVTNVSALKELWSWLSAGAKVFLHGENFSFHGIQNILAGVKAGGRKREKSVHPASGAASSKLKEPRKSDATVADLSSIGFDAFTASDIQRTGTAKAEERNVALLVCGWNFAQGRLEGALKDLELKNKHAKAAAWALFNGEVIRAIAVLQNSQDEKLVLVSTILAGYHRQMDSPAGIWKDLCLRLSSEFKDKYLRAIFAYISSGSWKSVLTMSDLSMRDRVGIALKYLSDDELETYIDQLVAQAVAAGDIQGLLLTGLTPRGVDLLRKYVDDTADVQTACLVACQSDIRRLRHKVVDEWIECYRRLLDRWKLYHIRASFDILRGKKQLRAGGTRGEASEAGHKASSRGISSLDFTVQPQIFVRCSYCNQSVAHSLIYPDSGGTSNNHPSTASRSISQSTPSSRKGVRVTTTTAEGEQSAIKLKSTCCPGCTRPLPRCALCLRPLGTPADTLKGIIAEHNDRYPTGFESWFTWCQTCRHGGHAAHVLEWFKSHRECPVTNCDCQCRSQDVEGFGFT